MGGKAGRYRLFYMAKQPYRYRFNMEGDVVIFDGDGYTIRKMALGAFVEKWPEYPEPTSELQEMHAFALEKPRRERP